LNEKCVPFYLCKDGTINTDGSFLIDERMDVTSHPEQNICKQMTRCCKKEFTNHPDKLNDTAELRKVLCNKEDFKVPTKCGQHNPKGIGGEVRSMQNKTLYAQYAEFPWMIVIMVERPENDTKVLKYHCGGSLIHPKVVLTTAHNIAGIEPSKFVVRGGEWDTESNGEMCEHQDRKIKTVIRHPEFVRSTLHNDIALLVLHRGFEMTAFVNTICLPPVNTNFDCERCFSAGWGKDKFGGVYQKFLKKVELPVVPHDECERSLRENALGRNFTLSDDFLCAGRINLTSYY
jgi:plasma kallikrein